MPPDGRPGPHVARVSLALARALGRAGLLEPGERVVLAVSGGPDSAALLAAHRALPRRDAPYALALHVNHGLQPGWAEAAAEAASRQARALGIPFESVCLEPAPDAASEGWARAGRLREFEVVARRHGAAGVITAHHRGDQVETVVMRLLRGAGTRGLAGIPELRLLAPGVSLIRPFLDLARGELAMAAREAGIGALIVEDPSNADLRFLRNRVRHRILPELRRRHGPGLDEAMLAAARQLRRAQELMEGEVAALRGVVVRETGVGGFVLDLGAFLAAPRVVRAHLVLDLLHRLDRRTEPRRVHVDAILALADKAPGLGPVGRATFDWALPRGAVAKFTRERILLLPPGTRPPGRGRAGHR